jgi:hypothetical protein
MSRLLRFRQPAQDEARVSLRTSEEWSGPGRPLLSRTGGRLRPKEWTNSIPAGCAKGRSAVRESRNFMECHYQRGKT